jgi:hypothetical protein
VTGPGKVVRRDAVCRKAVRRRVGAARGGA